MQVGIIDLGTNSARFAAYQIHSRNRTTELCREKRMVRLGDTVFLEGKLDRGAIKRTIKAFRRFRGMIDDLRVERVFAVATCALREAKNGKKLLRLIEAETGIKVRIISGQEEAELIARGILTNEDIPSAPFALIDIGGGSTEISLCRGPKILKKASLRLGAARLQKTFLKNQAKDSSHLRSIDVLRRHINKIMNTSCLLRSRFTAGHMIGSGGTIKALCRIAKKNGNGKTLAASQLQQMIGRMQHMAIPDLLEIPGMDAKRADMILAGAILLEQCMSRLGAKYVSPTKYSLRDGLLARELEAC